MKISHCAARLETKFASGDAKAGTFSGYGSVFDVVDSYNDSIAKGAFTKSLANWKSRGSMPKMLLQHGGGMFGGAAEDGIPIGRWTSMEEDSHGLAVEGELFALDTQKGKYIYEGLKSGALDGLSIGFVPVGYKMGTEKDDPERTLTEIDLWECSIVSFPANAAAMVTSVKAKAAGALKAIDGLMTLPDFEEYLREEGFSRTQATAFVSSLKKRLRQSESDVAVNDLAQGLLSKLKPTR